MTKPLKIIHISTVHHPLDTRILYKQCFSLANEGYEVHLIVQSHQDLQNINLPDNLYIWKLNVPKNRFYRVIFTVWEAYKIAKKIDGDIYHLHDPEILTISTLLKKNNGQVVFDVHEDYETSIKQKKYLSKPLRLLLAKIYKRIEKILTKSCHLVLAEKYYKEKFPKSKTVLNYPIVNDNEKIRTNKQKKERSNWLIYTGNVTEARGALYHAKIPKYLNSRVGVYFVGYCSETIAKKIYERSEIGIEINGVGHYVPRDEMDKIYNNNNWLAGVAIFPWTEHYYKKELTKFFEYMLHEIPIICSNFKVWKDFVESYNCGIAVDPEDDQDQKAAIEYLMNNPEEAKQMGVNGRKAVLEELNWENEFEKLKELYSNILNES
ncbi:glycosyltransferase [Natranaerobius trueperi]|uniref:glycosyltransferase n=1 Tax=Natranaerobius trueperi TaxID=759412 RepID=UPI00197B17DA|nr:glycosyltransferase [Natranaerobius trueperi]